MKKPPETAPDSFIPILNLEPQYRALRPALHAAMERVCASQRFILGEEVTAFEAEVAQYLGAAHAVGVNSGTDALVIALRALDIGPGDEVITTPFSFFATAEAISLVGATPVFADIEADSFNLDPRNVEACITPRTRAILPVHLFGRPAAMGRLLELAERHGLAVIEDAAQAFGAQYSPPCAGCDGLACAPTTQRGLQGRYVGTLGTLGTFSFYPSKNLGAYGDGGLIVTNDAHLAERCRKLRSHGSLIAYQHEMLGYNSRLDALQAAILRVKLPYVAEWNAARRAIAETYHRAFAGLPGVVTPAVTPGHVFHQYTLRIQDGRRDAVRQRLTEQRIGTMVYYPTPIHQLPVYAGRFPPQPVSEVAASEVLSLPMWPEMTESEQLQVTNAVARALSG
ncbi:MAG: DegT/DnrJ/EryC1/StrS family aminotransferase [Chloracidobacterium sp.]|nr:DegT/DnrJ/EryC1/StrS family aminotransferase [Chloracidobacterium sp.]MDW8218873.1 DegT/DnrJ/EryC1/StrS family aminotransferase [Acidobacteriota bacterium]